MIDIHCHILPNVDDGAKAVQESIKMAKEAVSEGITSIIATPHHKNGRYENRKAEIVGKVEELNEVLETESIPLKILPGQEPRIYGELLNDFHKGDILTLNGSGKYLLVELPSGDVPIYTERLFYEIQMTGLIPIIVHPERNSRIAENPDLLYELINKGALSQVTASSIAGVFGHAIRKFSMQLIEANLVHFIASDAHNVHNRCFKVNEAYSVVEKRYGLDMVYYFKENAELLIEEKAVYKEIPEKVKKKKLMWFF